MSLPQDQHHLMHAWGLKHPWVGDNCPVQQPIKTCTLCAMYLLQVCVHKWFDVQRTTGTNCTCPYCRRKLRFSDLTHDPTIQQQLDQLSVLCPNAPAGCPAVMARADLPAHLQHSCMHEAVSCRFCGQAGVRSEIQEHERSSCRKRLVPCQHAAAGECRHA